MNTNLSLDQREPLAVRAAVTAAVTATVHVAVVLGLGISPEAELAIGGAVDAAGLVVVLLWARPRIVPAAKVISRVTTDGGVVTGEAAAAGPDVELIDVDDSSGVAPKPTVEPVEVDPNLVEVLPLDH